MGVLPETRDPDAPAVTVAPPRSAIPTGSWGRPARSRPDPAVVDLRTPAGPPLPPAPFRPVGPPPPPPTPPGHKPLSSAGPVTGQARLWAHLRGLWREHRPAAGRLRAAALSPLAELAVGLVLLIALAAFLHPRTPAPLSAEQAWLARAGPSLDALAVDVAGGGASGPALQRDLRHLRAFGPPPQAAPAARWAAAVQLVEAAVRAPGHARGQLAEAGLDLVALSGSGPIG